MKPGIAEQRGCGVDLALLTRPEGGRVEDGPVGWLRGLGKKSRTLWLWGAGPACILLLVLVGLQVPAAWAARTGDGRPGVWTATEAWCRGTHCRATGNFVPDDGSPARRDVNLAGRDFQPEVGSQWRAIDPDLGMPWRAINTEKDQVFVLVRDGGGTELTYTLRE